MRIWSVHPRYLDSKGLVALWRETLLAKNVLTGNTKGYLYHPQLIRFKKTENPISSIDQYLIEVYKEALERGYNFDKYKINWQYQPVSITVTKGQIIYETNHLLGKLKVRDISKYKFLLSINNVEPHPMFNITQGEIEDWEVLS